MSPAPTCWCVDGWLCQRHAHEPWPHDDCPGPGVRCLRTDCPRGRTNLREAIARWRTEGESATAVARTALDRQIKQSEMRLALWERAHRDD